jgi:NADPH-dependent glutamate synthase beta subunit-like oxidoreductase
LNREVRSLAKIGSWVDLVNESVFWSDEVHQLHDTDVKSFIPALEGAMNFIGRFSPTGTQCL